MLSQLKAKSFSWKFSALLIALLCLFATSFCFALVFANQNSPQQTQIETIYADSPTNAVLSRDWKEKISGFNLETLTKITFQKVNNLSEITKPTTNVKDDTSTLDVLAVYEYNKATIYFTSTKLSLPTDSSRLFSDATVSLSHNLNSLTTIDGMTLLDTSNVTNMSHMFDYCKALQSLDVSAFNTSNVTNMNDMFNYCEALQSLDVSAFNTSNVTNMNDMFHYCEALQSLDVSAFNTSNVTNMQGMFSVCRSLQTLDISNFNTNNVTTMGSMFADCSSLKALTFPSTLNTSKVTQMYRMFEYCRSLQTLDLSNFNTSNVTDMNLMFWGCDALQTLDLSSFDTSNVTDMNGMFLSCDALQTLDLSSFDTSNVTDMSSMFSACKSLTKLDLSNFNMRSVSTSRSLSLSNFFKYTTALSQITCPYNIPNSKTIDLEKNFYRANSNIPITELSSSVCSTESTPLTLYSTPNTNPSEETPSEEDPIIPPIGEDPEDPPSPPDPPVEEPEDPPTGEDPEDPPIEEDPEIPPIEEDPETPPILIAKPVGNSFVYDGFQKSFLTETADYLIINGVTAGTNVADYILTLRLKSGRAWEDLTSGDINVTFSITKGQAVITLSQNEVTRAYGDVSPRITAITNFGTIIQSIRHNGQIATEISGVGDYVVTYKVEDSANFFGDTKTANVRIVKKNIELVIKKVSSAFGEALVELTFANVIENSFGLPIDFGNFVSITKEEGLDVGLYDLIATCTHPNYNVSFSSGEGMY